eukprot:421556-Pelagomonas_calceolata.AAC.1
MFEEQQQKQQHIDDEKEGDNWEKCGGACQQGMQDFWTFLELDANLTWAASMMKLGRVEATHSFVGGPLLAVNNRERGLHPDAKEEMRHANSGECLLSSASIMQLLVWKNGL